MELFGIIVTVFGVVIGVIGLIYPYVTNKENNENLNELSKEVSEKETHLTESDVFNIIRTSDINDFKVSWSEDNTEKVYRFERDTRIQIVHHHKLEETKLDFIEENNVSQHFRENWLDNKNIFDKCVSKEHVDIVFNGVIIKNLILFGLDGIRFYIVLPIETNRVIGQIDCLISTLITDPAYRYKLNEYIELANIMVNHNVYFKGDLK